MFAIFVASTWTVSRVANRQINYLMLRLLAQHAIDLHTGFVKQFLFYFCIILRKWSWVKIYSNYRWKPDDHVDSCTAQRHHWNAHTLETMLPIRCSLYIGHFFLLKRVRFFFFTPSFGTATTTTDKMKFNTRPTVLCLCRLNDASLRETFSRYVRQMVEWDAWCTQLHSALCRRCASELRSARKIFEVCKLYGYLSESPTCIWYERR